MAKTSRNEEEPMVELFEALSDIFSDCAKVTKSIKRAGKAFEKLNEEGSE